MSEFDGMTATMHEIGRLVGNYLLTNAAAIFKCPSLSSLHLGWPRATKQAKHKQADAAHDSSHMPFVSAHATLQQVP